MTETRRESEVRLLMTGRVLPGKNGGAPESNMTHGLFALCREFVKPEYVVCEIGSFAGVSSEVFSLFAKEVHCVDTWVAYCDIPNDEDFVGAEKEFDEMAERRGNIVKKKGTSVEVAAEYGDGYFDFAYIDAAHSFEGVVEDIKTWFKKVRPFGFISGHDFDLPPVKKAVLSLFPAWFITTYNDNSWLVLRGGRSHV